MDDAVVVHMVLLLSIVGVMNCAGNRLWNTMILGGLSPEACRGEGINLGILTLPVITWYNTNISCISFPEQGGEGK